MVSEDFSGRVLSLDSGAARDLAAILARSARMARPIPMVAAQNAAIARANGARLATLNPDAFAGTGVELINPLDQDPR